MCKIKIPFSKIAALILVFSLQNMKGQFKIPESIKSPNVSTMEKFGDIPVNLFTGSPNITIPLYTLTSGNINVPITLRYNSSLVQPNRPPGWMGLGWDLECTAAITRRARGYYDEYYILAPIASNIVNYINGGANIVESDNNWYTSGRMYYEYLKQNGFSEQYADEFNFNFLGHSGKFYYSGSNKGWVVVSDEKIKIEVSGLLSPAECIKDALWKWKTHQPQSYYNNREGDLAYNQTSFFKEFTLITPDGTRYTFGGIDGVEFTTNFKDTATPYNGINLSSWLLKKIVDVNGRTVTYNYKRDYAVLSLSHNTNSYSAKQNDEIYTGGLWGTGSKGSSSSSSSESINPNRLYGAFVFPMYITSIESNLETINFTSSTANTLNYKDFQITGGGHIWGDAVGDFGYWTNNTKWNKLTSIDVTAKVGNTASVNNYTFEYFEDPNKRFALSKLNILGSNTTNFKKYEFLYDDIGALPSLYGGNYTDHWGFFNNISITSSLEEAFLNKRTDESYVTKGLLTKIIYPTGGTTSFTWEAHKHSRVLADRKNSLNPYVGFAGGSRISELKSYSDTGVLALQKKYYYVSGYNSSSNPSTLTSSGVLNGIPKYNFSFTDYKGAAGVTKFSMNSFSLNSYTDSNPSGNGSHIGYDEVVEVNMDKSYTKHYFSNYGIDINGVPHYDKEPLEYTGWQIDNNSIYMNFSSVEMERGKEIGTFDYNAQDILVQKKKTIFRNDPSRFDQFIKQKIVSNYFASPTSGDVLLFAVAIKNFTYNYYPISQEVTNYDLTGLNPITTIKNFSYNSNNQVSEEVLLNSKNELLSTKYFYPQDYITEPFMQQLVNINKIESPISTEKYLFTNMLFKDKTVYTSDDTTSSLLLPKNTYAAKFPNALPTILNIGNLEKKITYDKYDGNGTLLQYTPESGMPVTIIWGYNKTQPIAKIENITYDNIIARYITVAQSASNTDTETNLLIALANLRNSLPTTSMVTTYTYKPLIGVSTITDPKGEVVYYKYDDFNRLWFVRDHNMNVLQRYCYNYKGQQTDCSKAIYFSASKSGGTFIKNCPAGSVGSSVTYTVAAGTYTSTISQNDADVKAQADVTDNELTYANNNGICTFNSVAINQTYNKNDCAAGNVGSSVNYTAAAGSSTSTISQADANANAQAAGQAYANANGTCTKAPVYTNTGSIYNNTGHTISAGTMQIIANGNTMCSLAMPALAAGATFNFSTGYSSPIFSNGTFVLKLYSATVGIVGTNYFNMTSGSSSTNGYFSNQGWGWQATVTSTGAQYALSLKIN